MHGRRGVCMAGGHAWWGGACVAGGCTCHTCPPDTMRYGWSIHGRYASYWNAFLLLPANKVCEGYVSTGVCPHRGGMHGWLGLCGCSGGCMCGCSWGWHVWLLWGACMVSWGAYTVALEGMCMVALGGHAWFLVGGMHGFFRGGGACVGYDEIRSMSGRYASYWNAFLFAN